MDAKLDKFKRQYEELIKEHQLTAVKATIVVKEGRRDSGGQRELFLIERHQNDIDNLAVNNEWVDYYIVSSLIALDAQGDPCIYMYGETEEWEHREVDPKMIYWKGDDLLIIGSEYNIVTREGTSPIRTFKEYMCRVLQTTDRILWYNFKHSNLKCEYKYYFDPSSKDVKDIPWDDIPEAVVNETDWCLLYGSVVRTQMSDGMLKTFIMGDGVLCEI